MISKHSARRKEVIFNIFGLLTKETTNQAVLKSNKPGCLQMKYWYWDFDCRGSPTADMTSFSCWLVVGATVPGDSQQLRNHFVISSPGWGLCSPRTIMRGGPVTSPAHLGLTLQLRANSTRGSLFPIYLHTALIASLGRRPRQSAGARAQLWAV